MAAEVSSAVRPEGKTDLITRDLLGGGALLGSSPAADVVDLELQIPAGWERRLDLLSGKTYLEKRSGAADPAVRNLHDLNQPPPSAAPAEPDEPPPAAGLDLRLAGGGYQSVCTLEKVKSALERAARDPKGGKQQQRSDGGGSPSPSSSTTSSSIRRRERLGEEADGQDSVAAADGGMIAAGCPSCYLYVLISKGDPRCPKCDSHVPVPGIRKKARIDLNSSSSTDCFYY